MSSFPEMGVLELEQPLVYRKAGWIFTREGHFLPHHSWYGKNVSEIKRIPKFLPRGKYLPGTTVSLASDFAVKGYGHIFFDCLSRLHLFFKAGYTFEDVDYVFCPKPTKGHAEYLFNKLGIPKEKLIWADDNRSFRPEKLLAISFPGTRRNYPPWVPEFNRKSFLEKGSVENKRRLYISRQGYVRNPSNIKEVEATLLKYDFEIYDPVAHEKAHLDFNEAEIVVGGSGSNLTGLVFCQAKTKVLELISDDHIFPYYYTLSDAADLDFSCLVCKSEGNREKNAWGPSNYDYYVDISELENALSSLLNDSAKP